MATEAMRVAQIDNIKRTIYRVTLPEETRGEIFVAGLSSVALLAAHLDVSVVCSTELARDMGDYAQAYNLKVVAEETDT